MWELLTQQFAQAEALPCPPAHLHRRPSRLPGAALGPPPDGAVLEHQEGGGEGAGTAAATPGAASWRGAADVRGGHHQRLGRGGGGWGQGAVREQGQGVVAGCSCTCDPSQRPNAQSSSLLMSVIPMLSSHSSRTPLCEALPPHLLRRHPRALVLHHYRGQVHADQHGAPRGGVVAQPQVAQAHGGQRLGQGAGQRGTQTIKRTWGFKFNLKQSPGCASQPMSILANRAV